MIGWMRKNNRAAHMGHAFWCNSFWRGLPTIRAKQAKYISPILHNATNME